MKLLSAWKMRQMPFGKMVNGLWKTVLFMILVKMELAARCVLRINLFLMGSRRKRYKRSIKIMMR